MKKLIFWVDSSPQMPSRLQALLDKNWTTEASLEVDQWLWYISTEFEGVQS